MVCFNVPEQIRLFHSQMWVLLLVVAAVVADKEFWWMDQQSSFGEGGSEEGAYVQLGSGLEEGVQLQGTQGEIRDVLCYGKNLEFLYK